MLFLIAVLSVLVCTRVAGHGYLMEPPARNTAWREDPENFEINWTDNQLNCGGFSNHWQTQAGKCGICGDPYQGPHDHEAGGKYAKLDRHVTRCYSNNYDVIDIHVVITSNHKGYFEFRLCEHNSMVTRANQSCFDNGLLLTVHGSGKTRYEINGNQQPEYHFKLDKPRASRARSVFSSGSTTPCFRHVTGSCLIGNGPTKVAPDTCRNAWGCDDAGKCGVGVGPQEQFINCADIAILDNCTGAVAVQTKDSTASVKPSVSPGTSSASLSQTTTPPTAPASKTTPPTVTPRVPSSSEAASGMSFHCRGIGDWNTPKNMEWWCTNTCKYNYSACPQNMCLCNGRP